MSDKELPLILLVDDSVINTRLLEMALTEYRTRTASNGADAVSIAFAHLPDLILLDVQMPDMDGFEVCRILKGRSETRDIPIIFLTGMAEPGSIARGFSLGAADYITKPFDFTEVKARIRTHLTLCFARRELERQNRLLEETVREQQLNIKLSRAILSLINGRSPRYVDIDDRHALFVLPLCCPCKEEGGDHFLVKTVPLPGCGAGRTVVSVKDQSGHAVNCVLRSIITDLFHNALLARDQSAAVATVTDELNNRLLASGSLDGDTFCTAMNLEIDHRDLSLEYVSAGHPPFFFIRNGRARMLPDGREAGGNLPLAVKEGLSYRGGRTELLAGDRLLIYTDGLNELGGRDLPLRGGELLSLVEEADQDSGSVSETVARLLHRLTAHPFGGPAFKRELRDDITLLALEVEQTTPTAEHRFLPRDYPCIDELIEEATRTVTAAAGPAVDPARLQMVLGEAVLNAWRHGNREDPELPITVRCWHGNDFNLEIADRGEGFDPAGIDDPTGESGRTRSTGRGIFIMRTFGTWLRWRDGGRRCVVSMAAGEGIPPYAGGGEGFPLWKYMN
ncbi:MAG: response regulator [Thermodesulfobacteriota bacterium]